MNLPVIYQRSTKADLRICYELVSSRARAALGLEVVPLRLQIGVLADLVILANTKSTTEAVTSGERDRTVLKVRKSALIHAKSCKTDPCRPVR